MPWLRTVSALGWRNAIPTAIASAITMAVNTPMHLSARSMEPVDR